MAYWGLLPHPPRSQHPSPPFFRPSPLFPSPSLPPGARHALGYSSGQGAQCHLPELSKPVAEHSQAAGCTHTLLYSHSHAHSACTSLLHGPDRHRSFMGSSWSECPTMHACPGQTGASALSCMHAQVKLERVPYHACMHAQVKLEQVLKAEGSGVGAGHTCMLNCRPWPRQPASVAHPPQCPPEMCVLPMPISECPSLQPPPCSSHSWCGGWGVDQLGRNPRYATCRVRGVQQQC